MRITHILPLMAMSLCLAALGPHTGQGSTENETGNLRLRYCYELNGCKKPAIPGVTTLQQCIEVDGASWMDENGTCHTDLDTSSSTPKKATLGR